MVTTNKELAGLIVKFLDGVLTKGEVSVDNKDSLDFAVDSVADAFGIDRASVSELLSAKFGDKGLAELVDAGLASSQAAPSARTAGTTASAPTGSTGDASVKKEAEALKLEGNQAMAKKDYNEAVEKYSQAIALDGSNAVYLSNRAAAYSSLRKHDLALADAKQAIELDPHYAKAYSRLGLAKYALGDAKGAMDAYKEGLNVEGSTPSAAMQRGYETARKRVADQMASSLGSEDTPVDPTRDAASAGAGAGAGAGAANPFANMGGLADMMNNPQIMQAAQRMMQNPEALSSMMNNPQIRQMAESMGGLGGAGGAGGNGAGPNMADLMNNPMLQNLANQFMGGANNTNNGNNGSTQ